jgi:hypothetical protein
VRPWRPFEEDQGRRARAKILDPQYWYRKFFNIRTFSKAKTQMAFSQCLEECHPDGKSRRLDGELTRAKDSYFDNTRTAALQLAV